MTQFRKRKGSKGEKSFPIKQNVSTRPMINVDEVFNGDAHKILYQPQFYTQRLTKKEKVRAVTDWMNAERYKFDFHSVFGLGNNQISGVITTKRGAKYYVRAFFHTDTGDVIIARSTQNTEHSHANAISFLINGQLLHGKRIGRFHPSTLLGDTTCFTNERATHNPYIGLYVGNYTGNGNLVSASQIISVNFTPEPDKWKDGVYEVLLSNGYQTLMDNTKLDAQKQKSDEIKRQLGSK